MSDKKIGVNDGTYDAGGVKLNSTPDDKIDFYTADVVTANDYYPFGMLMPGRKFAANNKYKYGFNGKENDDEVKGEGNIYDYGFRIYDPSVGRFLSVDPLSDNFPFYTPYQFAGNVPTWAIDLDGLEISLPRVGWNWGSWLSLPKFPAIPLEPMSPPSPPIIPEGFLTPQTPSIPAVPYIPIPPSSPSIVKSTPINEEGINPNDATTYPTPPFAGEWKVTPIKPGVKGYNKLKDEDATRLENEKGDVLRWHKADKWHPKSHWDFKEGGNPNKPWENYTPDGVKIPDGQIYGKDFNPPALMVSDAFPVSGYKPVEYPKYLEKQYFTIKRKIVKYMEQVQEYQKNLKNYHKQMEKYNKEVEKYEKKLKEYREENPPLI